MANRLLVFGSLVVQCILFSQVLCLQDSGVPCYLRPVDDSCHYFAKTDPTECMSNESKAALNSRLLHLNKSLTGLEQLLVRLGVIPPDDACPELPAVSNGGIVYSDLSLAPGCSAKYVCNEGYTLFGHRTFNCTIGGIWEGNITQIPICEATVTQCDIPIDINNGNVTFEDNDPENILLGDGIRYECEEGYKLAGSEERFCLKTGNWSGSEPQCIETKPSGLQSKDDKNQKIAGGVSVGGVIILAIATVLVVVGGRAAYKKWKGRKETSTLIVQDEPAMNTGGYQPIVSPQHTATPHVTVRQDPKREGKAGRNSSVVEASL